MAIVFWPWCHLDGFEQLLRKGHRDLQLGAVGNQVILPQCDAQLQSRFGTGIEACVAADPEQGCPGELRHAVGVDLYVLVEHVDIANVQRQTILLQSQAIR